MPKRILEGVVVSDKGDKTVIVKVERTFLHVIDTDFAFAIGRGERYGDAFTDDVELFVGYLQDHG